MKERESEWVNEWMSEWVNETREAKCITIACQVCQKIVGSEYSIVWINKNKKCNKR